MRFQAQVVSSDALKNIPFFLISSTDNRKHVDFIPNNAYAKKYIHPEGKKARTEKNVVKIPKDIQGFVKVGKYHISQSMEHMPLVRKIETRRFNGLVVVLTIAFDSLTKKRQLLSVLLYTI